MTIYRSKLSLCFGNYAVDGRLYGTANYRRCSHHTGGRGLLSEQVWHHLLISIEQLDGMMM